MSENTEIGAYEAKSRLPAFIRAVEKGARFTITQRGRPVAELVPYGTSRRQERGAAARALQSFMRKHPPVRNIDIQALIEEGRD